MDQDQNRNGGDPNNLIKTVVGSLRPPAIAPSLVGILMAVLFVLTIFTVAVLLETPGQASEVNQEQTTQVITHLPPSSNCPSGDYVSCLSNDLNMEITEFDGTNPKYTKEMLAEDVFNAFSIAYNGSALYRQLWGTNKLDIKYAVPPVGDEHTCQGQAMPDADYHTGIDVLYLWNFDSCSFYGGNAYLIIHETGHILAGRNKTLLFNGKFHVFYNSLPGNDGECYYYGTKDGGVHNGYYLGTYIGPGIYPDAETFAEGIADYVLYHTWWQKSAKPEWFKEYPTQCSDTFTWFKNNIFGRDFVAPNP